MSWFKLDDGFFHNRKSRAVGPEGRELFLASGCYCAMQLNNGCFIAEDLPVIAALAQVPEETAGRLYTHQLWHTEGTECAKCRAAGQVMPVPPGHISVHEYLASNPTREKVLGERASAAERQRQHRSRRESHSDSQRTNGVSSPVPSRPVPNTSVISSSSNSRAGPQPVDKPDDDKVPAAVWNEFAQLKLNRQKPGKVSDPGPWKTTTARNAQVEHAETAARWWNEYQVTPTQLAACLIDGKPPAAHYRRNQPA